MSEGRIWKLFRKPTSGSQSTSREDFFLQNLYRQWQTMTDQGKIDNFGLPAQQKSRFFLSDQKVENCQQ